MQGLRRIVLFFVLVVFSKSAFAQSRAFGNWKVDLTDPTTYYAGTVNDSEHEFGQYCLLDKGSCLWTFDMSTSCVEDSKYPVLANADSQAVHLEVICLGEVKGGYAYAFTDFDKVDKLIRSSKRVGIAVPLQDDQFAVFRWDLTGVEDALSAMRTAAEKASKFLTKSTRDQTL
jgi:hypothetical protein